MLRLCYNVYSFAQRVSSSEATRRSRSFLAAEAIREYVATNEWQIQEIRAALVEADAGDFASDVDVKALTDKWDGHAD